MCLTNNYYHFISFHLMSFLYLYVVMNSSYTNQTTFSFLFPHFHFHGLHRHVKLCKIAFTYEFILLMDVFVHQIWAVKNYVKESVLWKSGDLNTENNADTQPLSSKAMWHFICCFDGYDTTRSHSIRKKNPTHIHPYIYICRYICIF